MILCPISIETCFAFEFQGNKLKRSPGPSLTFLFQGERLKTSSGGFSFFLISGQESKKVPPDLPRFLISRLRVKRSTGLTLTFLFQGERLKTSTGGFYSQKSSNTVIGRWRLCWPLCHQFSIVAWASGLMVLPSR